MNEIGEALVSEETSAIEIAAAGPEDLAAWMEAVATRRDRDAFARLHAHFAPRLAAVLARGATTRDREDLVQETMLAVWRKAELYDPAKAGVATWIFTVARNLRIDRARRERGVVNEPIDDFDAADETPDGEARLIAAERDARVRAALERLSPDQVAAVRAAYWGDRSQSEIAADLGIPLGTVKSRLRLAAERLRALLEGDR